MVLLVKRRRARLLLQGLLLLTSRIRRHVGQPELPDQLTVASLVDVDVVHVQEPVLRGQQNPQGFFDPEKMEEKSF